MGVVEVAASFLRRDFLRPRGASRNDIAGLRVNFADESALRAGLLLVFIFIPVRIRLINVSRVSCLVEGRYSSQNNHSP